MGKVLCGSGFGLYVFSPGTHGKETAALRAGGGFPVALWEPSGEGRSVGAAAWVRKA